MRAIPSRRLAASRSASKTSGTPAQQPGPLSGVAFGGIGQQPVEAGAAAPVAIKHGAQLHLDKAENHGFERRTDLIRKLLCIDQTVGRLIKIIVERVVIGTEGGRGRNSASLPGSFAESAALTEERAGASVIPKGEGSRP